ncbi:hypothetical protein BASH2_00985 [Bacillus anthracis]|nr:hypothetical protein BASH2_00985 [Bacillus anthracis]
MVFRKLFMVIMDITTIKVTKVTMVIKATIITKVTTVIMGIIITKVTTVIMGIINNKYITTAIIIYIHRLFFIKLIKVTKATMIITVTTVIKATTVNTVNSTNSTNNINNINNINNNLHLGQVELEQGQRGQRQERLVLVEQQGTLDTWVINTPQEKRHNKKLLGVPSSFFQLLGVDVRFQHEVVVLVLASLQVLEFSRHLRGIEVSRLGIVLPCLHYLQFRILYQDVRPFRQTCRMQSK